MFHFHQKKKEMEHSFAFFFFLWKSTILPCCLLSSILSRHMVTLVGFVLSFWLHWGLSPSCLWFVLFQEQEADQLNALKSKPLRRSEIKPNSPGHNWRWLTIQCFYSNCKGFLDNYFTHTVIQREQSRYCMCTYIKGYKEKENRVHIVSFVTPFFEKKDVVFSFYKMFSQLGNKSHYQNYNSRDFCGGPVVKTLPSNARSVGLIPGWEAKVPYASGPKTQNIKAIL